MPTTTDDPVTDHTIEAGVRAALHRVIDPCSLVNGTRLSLIDLGMIDTVERTPDGTIRIQLLLDDPLCLYMGPIQQQMRDQLSSDFPDVPVEITIRGDVVWTLDRATPETRRRVESWQQQRRQRLAERAIPLGLPRLRATPERT